MLLVTSNSFTGESMIRSIAGPDSCMRCTGIDFLAPPLHQSIGTLLDGTGGINQSSMRIAFALHVSMIFITMATFAWAFFYQ